MLKEKFKSFSNYPTKQMTSVTIDSAKYPVIIQGNGKIACLSVGGSTPVLRTLSPRFKETFTFYCCDFYFIEKNKLKDFSHISLEKIVDDIISTIDQLELKEVVLLGHSAFGIVALEVAKRRDPRIKGVVMLGTPTNSNQEVADFNDKFFHQYASLERKLDDSRRKEWYSNCERKDVFVNYYESQTARYWANYNEVDLEFIKEIWKDVEYDDKILVRFFSEILPLHKTEVDLDKIDMPVILFGGHCDYDCLPLELWKTFPKPKDFTVIDCGEIGHWPQIECDELFDSELEKWVKDKKIG